MKKVLPIAFLSSMFLYGCIAPLSQEECMNPQYFYQLGLQDGAQGSFPRTLEKEMGDCAKFNITINPNLYHKGWNIGVRQYCTYDKGFAIAASGGQKNNVCPIELAGAFERGWQKGLYQYCRPEIAFALGRDGKAFPSQCPPELLALMQS